MDFTIISSVICWIIFSIAIGLVGAQKEVGGWLAFFLSLIAGPLIGAACVFSSSRIDVLEHRKEVVKNQKEIIDLLTKLANPIANDTILPSNEQ